MNHEKVRMLYVPPAGGVCTCFGLLWDVCGGVLESGAHVNHMTQTIGFAMTRFVSVKVTFLFLWTGLMVLWEAFTKRLTAVMYLFLLSLPRAIKVSLSNCRYWMWPKQEWYSQGAFCISFNLQPEINCEEFRSYSEPQDCMQRIW